MFHFRFCVFFVPFLFSFFSVLLPLMESGVWYVHWNHEVRRVSCSLSLCRGDLDCHLCGGRCRWKEAYEEDIRKKEEEEEEEEEDRRYWSYAHLLVLLPVDFSLRFFLHDFLSQMNTSYSIRYTKPSGLPSQSHSVWRYPSSLPLFLSFSLSLFLSLSLPFNLSS